MIESAYSIIELICLHIPLVIGAYVSMSLLKVPDLSIEAACVLGAIVSSKLILSNCLAGIEGIPFLSIMLVSSLLAGSLVGLISSFLTAFARIPHLLSALMTIGMFQGIYLLLLQGKNYISLTGTYNALSFPLIETHPELPMLVAIALGVTISIALLLKTQLAYCFSIYGLNKHFLNVYGISQRYILIMGIIGSNALAGLSGFLIAQTSNYADCSMGLGKALLCITIIMMGKMVWTAGQSVLVPVLGVSFYFIVQHILLRSGLDLKYFTAFQACLLLLLLILFYRNNTRAIKDMGI